MTDTDLTATRDTPAWKKAIDAALLEAYESVNAAGDDPEALGELLVVLGAAKNDVTEEYKRVCSLTAAAMGDLPEVTTPSGVVIEKRHATPRKTWRHAELGAEVARRVVASSVDMDTGEVLRSNEEMCVAMLEYAAPSYWRVKALTGIGIQADDYCETGEPEATVSIRSR